MFGKNKEEQTPDFEIFTIFDSKVKAYGLPTHAINEHDLVRQLINMFSDPAQAKNQYLVNAEDFSLFRIGKYYKKTGVLISQNAEHIANLHDLRALATPPRTINDDRALSST